MIKHKLPNQPTPRYLALPKVRQADISRQCSYHLDEAMPEVESFEQLKAIRDACISSAEDLLNAAKALMETGAFQISYHLAVLSLEEMGKLGLMEVKYNFSRFSKDQPYNPDVEDHVKKLFWAFFGLHLLGHKIDRSEFNSLRGIASQMHRNRLESLYVDVARPVPPRTKLTAEDVEPVIGLADTRISFEKSQRLKEPDAELDEIAKWFVLASEDPDKRSFILNDESYAKLSELQSFRKWIEWNKTRYEESRADLQKLLEAEIARTRSADTVDTTPKWKAYVTFKSDSHTIRPSFVSEWTKHAKYIFVGKTSNNNELTCQFLVPKQVTIEDAYDKGFVMAKIMAVALSVGTMGYFWWYVPSDRFFYTERIIDLENDARLNFQPPKGLKVNWEPQALKAEHVFMIKLVMSYLTRIRGQQEEQALDSYLSGLALFAKCDCHLDFITNAFESFFRALKSAMSVNGDIAEGESFYDAGARYLGESITDLEAFKKHLEIGQVILDTKQGVPGLQLEDVASMKSYCDVYFLFRAAEVVRDSVYNKQ